ncbi:MAG: P-loop NTPase [Steroidobacteraceae bacterium]|jgi:flagellar biosynthesis protein FlhG
MSHDSGHSTETQAPATRRRAVRVIAVTGGKGGVGKSTVSVNLSAGLASLGQKTILLDGDLGLANADVMLGITPKYTLADVITGERSLEEVVVPVSECFSLVAGASGISRMAALGVAEHIGIVRAFSSLVADIDALVVDTAAGISPGVLQLTQAAQHLVVVVCDEPASVTDAYAVIKVLSAEHDIRHFKIVTNMTRVQGGGQQLFNTLTRVTNRFLDVILEHVGDIPDDDFMRRAIREQSPVITAYPGSPAGVALKTFAHKAAAWPLPSGHRGSIEFFAERLVTPIATRLQVIK